MKSRIIIPKDENPLLRQKAVNVPADKITTAKIQTLLEDMKKLLAEQEHGVALAAPQVGESLRIFIVSGRALSRGKRTSPDEEAAQEEKEMTAGPDLVYINPEIVKMSRGRYEKHEGCLSMPGKWGTVPRAEKVTLRAYDENGVQSTRGAAGFLAHIFQHEMDHLEGILYTDKATQLYDDVNKE